MAVDLGKLPVTSSLSFPSASGKLSPRRVCELRRRVPPTALGSQSCPPTATAPATEPGRPPEVTGAAQRKPVTPQLKDTAFPAEPGRGAGHGFGQSWSGS